MTRDHKSIIERAKRDGLLPMEMAEQLMGHDLLEIMLDEMKSHAVAYKNMSEMQQDATIARMQEGLKDAIKTAVSIIGAQATKTVRLSLKGCAVGKKLKVTGEVSATEEWKHELLDAATDQADVLVILNERDFLQGMDAHHGDKQQKLLDIDGDEMTSKVTKAKVTKDPLKAVPKEKAPVVAITDVKPELVDKARTYVIESRNPTTAGLQNLLSKGFSTAETVLAILAQEGVIVANEDGTYAMPALVVEPVIEPAEEIEDVPFLTKAQQKKSDAEAKRVAMEQAIADEPEDAVTELTEHLMDNIKAKCVRDGEVYASGLVVSFDISEELANQAIDSLELEGFISPEDDFGVREILGAAAE